MGAVLPSATTWREAKGGGMHSEGCVVIHEPKEEGVCKGLGLATPSGGGSREALVACEGCVRRGRWMVTCLPAWGSGWPTHKDGGRARLSLRKGPPVRSAAMSSWQEWFLGGMYTRCTALPIGVWGRG